MIVHPQVKIGVKSLELFVSLRDDDAIFYEEVEDMFSLICYVINLNIFGIICFFGCFSFSNLLIFSSTF